MRAILIDSEKQTVTYVELPDDGTKRMRELHRLIGCSSYTMGGVLPTGDVLFVDDEGLLTLTEDSMFFQIEGMQPLAGNGVIVGAEDWDEDLQEEIELEVQVRPEDLQIAYSTLFEMQVQLAEEKLDVNLDLG